MGINFQKPKLVNVWYRNLCAKQTTKMSFFSVSELLQQLQLLRHRKLYATTLKLACNLITTNQNLLSFLSTSFVVAAKTLKLNSKNRKNAKFSIANLTPFENHEGTKSSATRQHSHHNINSKPRQRKYFLNTRQYSFTRIYK